MHDYYSGRWDGILHYNGKADGTAAPGDPDPAPSGDASELAARVIAGDFGNGTSSVKQTPQCGVCSEKARASSERCPCLGDRYSAVQRRVNEMLS